MEDNGNGHDEDPECGELTLVSVTPPLIGTIAVDGNEVTYTPGIAGEEECRDLAGTDTNPDGYQVVMDYVIRDDDDNLEA